MTPVRALGLIFFKKMPHFAFLTPKNWAFLRLMSALRPLYDRSMAALWPLLHYPTYSVMVAKW